MPKFDIYRFRWALITGASSGIGSEFAVQLAQKGLNVILIGRNSEALSSVADKIHRISNVSVVMLQADLTKELDSILVNLSRFNIDLLVNNAGFGLYGDFLNYSWNEYENMIKLNIEVLARLSYHYAKEFSKRGSGGIINVSSVAGFMPIPHFSVYAATKAFVYSFSLSLWAELKDKNVHVLCVAPGKTKTKFFERAKMSPGNNLMSPEKVVKGALKAFEKDAPLYIPGLGNKLSYYFVRKMFSDKLISKILVKYF